MPYEELKPEVRAMMVAKRGESETRRFELTSKVTAAFEDHRPQGRRFHPYVRHSPVEWADDLSRPPIEVFQPDSNAEMDHRLLRRGRRVMQMRRVRVPCGNGSIIHVEIWEDVNYKPGVDVQRGHVEKWVGIRLEVKREATAQEISDQIKAAFASGTWDLKG